MLSLKSAAHASLALLAVAWLSGGCVTTHSTDDAAALDARAGDAPLPDAYALPDAFVCVDNDRDGALAPACGGEDCDDDNAALGPARPVCSTPTTSLRCAAGVTQTDVCTGATPYCDARTGACVADACGDHVVHANEQCDDGRDRLDIACADCRIICSSSEDCDTGLACIPYFSTDYMSRQSGCAPANVGGAELGARCTANADCYSNLCSPTDARCTESAASSSGACSGPHRWSEYAPVTRPAEGLSAIIAPYSTCAFECEHNSECAASATCVPMSYGTLAGTFIVAGCRNDWARGTVAQGEACVDSHTCASGVCVFERCSQQCRNDDDCEAGAPHCVAADRAMPPPEAIRDSWGGSPRPAEWGSPWPRVCLP